MKYRCDTCGAISSAWWKTASWVPCEVVGCAGKARREENPETLAHLGRLPGSNGGGAEAPAPRRPTRRTAPLAHVLEGQVQAAIERALSYRRDVYAWRNNTGALRNQQGRPVRFGLKGSADFLGVASPTGRFFALEVKRPVGGRQTEAQLRFENNVRRHGGVYAVVRSVDEAMAAVDEAAGIRRGRT